jgi:hypothetical protein
MMEVKEKWQETGMMDLGGGIIHTASITAIHFIEPTKTYRVDFSKVESLEDMKKVMSSVPMFVNNMNENFDDLKPFLKEC